MKHSLRFASIAALIGVFITSSYAITWFPQEFTCPIDNTKNTFMVVGSYGSYIYSYPSKYQYLFFPRTDSPTFYLCRKCHLATFMWDFDNLPKDKLPAIRKVLSEIKFSRQFKEYTEIPVTERLEIMERIYSVLDKNDSWWEDFYRIKGYHYGKEGKAEKAAEARRKSLELVQKEFKDSKSETPKKLLLYISAAMKHFTNDDKGALEDFQKALDTKYVEKDAKPEDLKNAEEGLNERIKEYVSLIKSADKKPRLFDKAGADEHGH
ncbi:MAG: hypothetical protein JWN60_2838 [Acidobacteria bacterium]|jgi:hypothetical protein|nr:hypothetical protein [Acidobacteriota bacterium]